MAQKKRRRRRQSRLPAEPVEAQISDISAEGRGITHIDEQVVFVDLALPGEQVKFKYTTKTSKYAEGITLEVLAASPNRVTPVCAAFDRCGGCSLQHMSHSRQIQLKQKMLLDQLEHVGRVRPETVLEPLTGPQTGYRHKARLGVRYVIKKDRVLVGFRERGGRYLAEMDACEVLHPSVGRHLSDIGDCLYQLHARAQIAQIEVAVGDNQTVLVFRHLEPLDEHDRQRLTELCQQHDYVGYLQAGKPTELEALWPEAPPPLFYTLADYGIKIEFQPSDFTQVNPEINRQMVSLALAKLELDKTHDVLDLFSGLGNFSLAMSRQCRQVTAVEGALEMVQKARHNAELNGVENTAFIYADLYSEETLSAPWIKKQYDRILIDPPRSGAAAILPVLKKMQADIIVYVSCHPATLARDAGVLVNEMGYTLAEAGIMDMFPHTAHVESIAVFKRKKAPQATKRTL